jgi:hypothetical protein
VFFYDTVSPGDDVQARTHWSASQQEFTSIQKTLADDVNISEFVTWRSDFQWDASNG